MSEFDAKLQGAGGGAPCNICGVNWPHHIANCIYVANAEDAQNWRSLSRELATIYGPMKLREGVTPVAYWLRRIGEDRAAGLARIPKGALPE